MGSHSALWFVCEAGGKPLYRGPPGLLFHGRDFIVSWLHCDVAASLVRLYLYAWLLFATVCKYECPAPPDNDKEWS